MGQILTTTKFYTYGRSHFSANGWKPQKSPDFLDTANLVDRVYMVTGANSGLGKELSRYLLSKGATVYMVCRNPERAEAARQELVAETGINSANVIIGDVATKRGVDKVVREFGGLEQQLHCLVCNAGALLNTKTNTVEGFETTFACHLLFGSYYLGQQLRPLLDRTPDSRLVIVTSGGMYNTKFPDWGIATAETGGYSSQLAYAYAKRGQVLMANRWAEEARVAAETKAEPAALAVDAAAAAIKDAGYRWDCAVPVVSAHPGWVDTPGVTAAYGSGKWVLQPLRTLWQGTDGIAWLCVAPREQLQNGALYLDRQVQPLHLPGITSTRNSSVDVDTMMARLEEAAQSVPAEEEETTKEGAAATAVVDDDCADDAAAAAVAAGEAAPAAGESKQAVAE